MKVDILECRTQFVLLYTGFSRGTVKIDTITSPITEGFQPEGDFTVDVKWKFCLAMIEIRTHNISGDRH
jgi:hypothetical protein